MCLLLPNGIENAANQNTGKPLPVYVVVQFYLWYNLFLNHFKIFWASTKFFNVGQYIYDFSCVCFCVKQKLFLASSIFSLSSIFSSSLLFLPHLLFPPCSPNIPVPILFILSNAYLVSLEPQTFGFNLDSCSDALPVSHGDLDASSPFLCIHNSSNTFL